MSSDEYRRASLEVWKAMAPGWERWRAHLEEAVAPVRAWLIRERGIPHAHRRVVR